MGAALAIQDGGRSALSAKAESLICSGNLSGLNDEEKVVWYKTRCEAAGLDYRTQPFQYVTLQGKLVLYATKTATEQAAEKRQISTQIIAEKEVKGIYIVTCRATEKSGRFTDAIGALNIEGLKGEALANAFMKCETKAKRRAILALSGLGMLDETEIDSIPGANILPANPVQQIAGIGKVDTSTGEIIDEKPTLKKITPIMGARGAFKAQVAALGFDIDQIDDKAFTLWVKTINFDERQGGDVWADKAAWEKAATVLLAFNTAQPDIELPVIQATALRKFGFDELSELNSEQWQVLATTDFRPAAAPAPQTDDSETIEGHLRPEGDVFQDE